LPTATSSVNLVDSVDKPACLPFLMKPRRPSLGGRAAKPAQAPGPGRRNTHCRRDTHCTATKRPGLTSSAGSDDRRAILARREERPSSAGRPGRERPKAKVAFTTPRLTIFSSAARGYPGDTIACAPVCNHWGVAHRGAKPPFKTCRTRLS